MPFGLENALGTFQRAIEVISGLLQMAICHCKSGLFRLLIRDACQMCWSRSVRTDTVDRRWCYVSSKIWASCKLYQLSGPDNNSGILEIASRTSDALRNLKPPGIVVKLKSSYGLCHVFQRLLLNLIHVAASLNENVWKDQPTRL